MPKHKLFLIITVVSILVGAVAFGIGEIKTTPKPVAECIPDGQPTSGFVIEKEDGTECKVSSQYVKEAREYDWPAHKRPMRFVMAGAILAAIVFGVTSLVMYRKSKKKSTGLVEESQTSKQTE